MAEIMTMLEQVIKSGIPHGRIAVGFTPDEEIGAGRTVSTLRALAATSPTPWTAARRAASITRTSTPRRPTLPCMALTSIRVRSKNTMINASLVAMEINAMLPSGDTPRDTDGYEGFFHLCSMSGNVEKAALEYIVRDHSATVFDARLETLRHIQKLINEKYGEGTAELTIREQYRNMIEMIRPCIQVVD